MVRSPSTASTCRSPSSSTTSRFASPGSIAWIDGSWRFDRRDRCCACASREESLKRGSGAATAARHDDGSRPSREGQGPPRAGFAGPASTSKEHHLCAPFVRSSSSGSWPACWPSRVAAAASVTTPATSPIPAPARSPAAADRLTAPRAVSHPDGEVSRDLAVVRFAWRPQGAVVAVSSARQPTASMAASLVSRP